MSQSSAERLVFPAIALASLGVLQPGIDPVFLTLLSSAHDIPTPQHGWIVTATQSGMAFGSVATWRWGSHFPRVAPMLAASAAALAALATAHWGALPILLALRCIYGMAMGVIYTQGMSDAARSRPHGSYGAVFLLQLLLATAIALALPLIADGFGARAALAMLIFAPISALLILLMSKQTQPPALCVTRNVDRLPHAATGARAWCAAIATLLFICATMMVWTFSGGLAVAAGLSEDVVGRAVAAGSLAGAITALLVMREQPVVPPPLTGLLSGLGLLSPIVAAQGGTLPFIASIVLLNISSTAVIVRSSGMASAASRDGIFRRFVACAHALGMILGPLAGSLAMLMAGAGGMIGAAVLAVLGACILLVLAHAPWSEIGSFRRREESLDEYLTIVQP
ncbi:putative MFS family arabinose efflux permease [Sphingobium fontiphilum]|uniref:Putative MFS family arabinose efflux permease n=1 Tax=Sphingobium fontiphilum TaxID=944425 RepID=A0A7W6DCN8_9SPHN|nr:putative MFS family arabinose efflux permease [Sphingobium fontiphilum]